MSPMWTPGNEIRVISNSRSLHYAPAESFTESERKNPGGKTLHLKERTVLFEGDHI
jgi:hypothetical protein